AIRQPIIGVLKHDQGVQWESLDGTLPQLVFLIAVPEQSHDTHLKVLQQLSKNLMHDDKRQRLLDTTNEAELYETLQRIIKA
ncbi:PTS sugar transporter subunit IIA, partial [Staphylococcus pseudintermedius]